MKLETKRFLKLKLLYLGPDRLKSLHSFRSTLLGTRPAESYNMNYTYALTSWWGVRPPSPAKETKNSPMTKKERNNSKLGDVGLNTHHFWSKNPCFLVFVSINLVVLCPWLCAMNSVDPISSSNFYGPMLWLTAAGWTDIVLSINET